VDQSSRPRVKQFLEVQQRRFETELITIKEKQEKEAAAATEKKATATVSSSTTTATRSYTKEISLYGKIIGLCVCVFRNYFLF
jgi:hypothetical protein